MPLPNLDVDEIITVINRSSLPTILVEGKYDAIVYRWIEAELFDINANIIECGGRKSLISVFERRAEITNNANVVFLADKDMWLYTGVPEEYNDIIFTSGYSIENDLIHGSINRIIKLFNPGEITLLEDIFKVIIPWYSIEVCKYINGEEFKLNYSIQNLLDKSEVKIREGLLDDNTERYSNYNEVFNFIEEERLLHIRGKNVLDILSYLLQSPKRKVNYSKDSIVDIILRLHSESNQNLLRVIELILARFTKKDVKIHSTV
ncbi:DUF4435 domain-containing protein [Lederbergia panacisoli]|uniref:DUF4435 domain-containing protein n=1 Tax=Lederbergia panacisoli TaxID=1255251 RepID=UPI00214CE8D7|nr:DUF4435 domain-containing protein [Lederbergia panacisoli]MCR2820037.1 DUF4435 domain-containing protein [Lederbergia panacisoli]